MLTVQKVYDLINALAPFDTQAAYDNAGLLVGHPDREVHGIHLALDVTDAVIDEALAAGANLIVTHHPLMFHARKRLVEMDREARLLCRLIRENMSLISAHTNFDQAIGGMNDTLAELLGLTHVVGEGFVRVGDLPAPMTSDAFAGHVQQCLKDSVRVMGRRDVLVHRVGLCTGAGDSEWQSAKDLGADAFIAGEIAHHVALEAVSNGVLMLEAGHFATENPGILSLMKALQNAPDIVQWNIGVSRSLCEAYW